MFKAVLLAFVLLLASSQLIGNTVRNVGGYQPYTDLSSQQFQNVLSFIHSNRPDLKDFKPTSVQRQLVNGVNYQVNLQSADECTCQITVYSTFQGELKITQNSPIACPQVTAVLPEIRISGGYTVQSNPSGALFQAALKQALARNTKYLRSDLVQTETQVVSGTNYRFTFRNQDGTLSQVVIYISLGGIIPDEPLIPSDPSGPVAVTMPIPISGGWREVSDKSNYADALQAVYDAYPEVKSYSISGVESQVVAGINFKIGLQSNSGGYIRYALFRVYVNLKGVATVTLQEWINETGYSVQQLKDNYDSSLQLHSELVGATLTRIENIWQKEGLAFTFEKDGKKNQVFIYSRNGKTNNLIF